MNRKPRTAHTADMRAALVPAKALRGASTLQASVPGSWSFLGNDMRYLVSPNGRVQRPHADLLARGHASGRVRPRCLAARGRALYGSRIAATIC
jgi:hypothetical protein